MQFAFDVLGLMGDTHSQNKSSIVVLINVQMYPSQLLNIDVMWECSSHNWLKSPDQFIAVHSHQYPPEN